MSFNDIRGQDRPISMLKDYLERSRLEGGYLFTGPEGVGKKLVAKTLAKAVNCLQDSSGPCGECSSCLKIDNGRHPDIHIIENLDTEIKIEYVRQLQRDISLRPYEARVKVFIIDNAHTMTAEASNALLKILEEPPSGSLIILISDKPGLLFKTIISRCKVLKFAPLSRPELKGILIKEHGLDSAEAHFLAYFSEGRIGRALKLKEAGALEEKNAVIDGLALIRDPASQGLIPQDKEEARGYLNVLAGWFRDIYLLKAGMPHSEMINLDRKNEVLSSMGRFSFSELNEIFNSISASALYLEQNVNMRLLLHNLRMELWKG